MATGTGSTGALALGRITALGAAAGLNVGVGAITLPRLTVSGFDIAAGGVTSGVSTCHLPALVVNGSGHFPINLPVLQVSGAGVTGRVGVGAVTLPALRVSGADQRIILPALTVAGVGVTDGWFGAGAIELPALAVAGIGAAHQIGTGAVTLPVFVVLGAGATPRTAVDATAGAPGSDTGKEFAAGEALVLNLRTAAASTYEDYAFNSFATFDGALLGANASGICVLGVAVLDGAAAIDWRARFGITDFGTSYQKRMDRVYVGHRTDGQLVAKVSVDGSDWYTYPIAPRAVTGPHGSRARIGKGLRGRYWQVEIASLDGASGTLDSVELVPALIARKVG